MVEPWQRIASEQRGEYKIFRVRQDRSRSPRSGEAHTFYVIEAGDWVNVIPMTPEGQLVFIRQYRHGIEAVTLEVPGGIIDPGETAAAAARREMHEETGYDTEQIVYLGSIAPNPALQNNFCHFYLASDARLDGPQRLDGAEDIDVVLIDPADVPALIVEGRINNGFIVAAFYYFDQYQRGLRRKDGHAP